MKMFMHILWVLEFFYIYYFINHYGSRFVSINADIRWSHPIRYFRAQKNQSQPFITFTRQRRAGYYLSSSVKYFEKTYLLWGYPKDWKKTYI